MNPDSRWKKELLRLATPPEQDGARDRGLLRALTALRQPPAKPEKSRAGIGSWLLAGGTVTILAAVVLLILMHLPGPADPGTALPSTALMTEMEKLFPRELKAVIVEDGEVTLRLADAPEVMPADQRVRVSLQRGGESLEVLTYSGRKVCMKVDGQPLCLTPLLTGENTVFVLTEDSVVLPSTGATLAGYRVSVEHLGGAPL